MENIKILSIEEAEYGLENDSFNSASQAIQSLSFNEFYTAVENILNKTMLLIYPIKLSIDYEKYRPNIF